MSAVQDRMRRRQGNGAAVAVMVGLALGTTGAQLQALVDGNATLDGPIDRVPRCTWGSDPRPVVEIAFSPIHARFEIEERGLAVVRRSDRRVAAGPRSSDAYPYPNEQLAVGATNTIGILTGRMTARSARAPSDALLLGGLGFAAVIALLARWLRGRAPSQSRHQQQGHADEKPATSAAERTVTEEQLQNHRNEVGSVLRFLPDALLITDRDGRITTPNEAALRLFGYCGDELIGLHVTAVLGDVMGSPPDPDARDGSGMGGAIDDLLIDGRDGCMEMLIRRMDGQILPATVSGSVLRGSEGRDRGLILVIREYAAQKKLESELSDANRQLVSVNEVHHRLFECTSVLEVAETLTASLVDKFRALFARVWLVGAGDSCTQCALAEHCQDRTKCLHLMASAGHYTHVDGNHRRVPVGAFKIGRIAQSRKSTISNDVTHDGRVHDRAWAERLELRSFAGIPLMRNGDVIGVLAMFSRHELPYHSLQALELLSQMGVSALSQVESAAELRDAEKRFMDCFFNSPDAALLLDGDRFVECNQRTIEMLGAQSRDEVLSTHPAALSPEMQPDGRFSYEKADAMIAMAFERGSNRFEWSHRRLDGRIVPVEVTLIPVPLSGHRLLYCVWKDVTERVHAEDRLRYLSLAVEQSPSSVVITDIDGMVEYVNDRFTEITGYSAREVVGRGLRRTDLGSWRECILDQALGNRGGGRAWNGEYQARRKNGEVYWEAASVCPIRDADGSVTKFLAVMQDVTNRKRVEWELQSAKDAAEAASEALRQSVDDLEKFNQLLVGRELRMIELKKEINALLVGAGRMEKYEIVDE